MNFSNSLLVLATTFASACVAADDPVQPVSVAMNCPAPMTTTPIYPPDALRSGQGGKVVMEATFDDCGRVLEVVLTRGSKYKELDKAAVVSIKASIFSADERRKAVNGKIERVINFTPDSGASIRPVDWPKTHKRPRYVLDDEAIAFASVAQASDAIKDSVPNVFRPPVFKFQHRFVQVEVPAGREFWLFLFAKTNMVAVAARYRPVMEPDGPAVRLSMKCELEKSQCEAVQDMLLKGLPFAKAR